MDNVGESSGTSFVKPKKKKEVGGGVNIDCNICFSRYFIIFLNFTCDFFSYFFFEQHSNIFIDIPIALPLSKIYYI